MLPVLMVNTSAENVVMMGVPDGPAGDLTLSQAVKMRMAAITMHVMLRRFIALPLFLVVGYWVVVVVPRSSVGRTIGITA